MHVYACFILHRSWWWAQFYSVMDMAKNGHPEPEVVPSSESSMFRSFSGSPDETSSLMPRSSNNTTPNNSCHHPAEVASHQQTELSPVTYGGERHYDHQCYGHDLDMILNQDEFKCQETRNERAHHKNGHGGGGAFMPYFRHLSPKKKPNKTGSGGQRAIKAAMSSAVARMHMVRLAQWRRYQMEMAAAPAPPTGGSNCNQQQHVLSERKRRERLNDGFKALRTVLPPASKVYLLLATRFILFLLHQLICQTISKRNIAFSWQKDKASILIRARDYVNTLKARVSELEEENRMLVELQHHCNNGGDVSGRKIQVDIDINREAERETSQEFHLKIVVGSECNAMDAIVSILECLKEIGDVRFVAMDTGSRATTLTLQMKV